MTPMLEWRSLGLRPYAEVLALQEQLVAQRQRGEGVDTLLLCEHPPVYTLGAGGAVEDLRGVQDVPIYRIGRGGGATWHGPGQLVGYPILRLRDWGWRVSDYLCALERTLIATLRAFGVAAHATDGTHGLWVDDRKIASIGIQASRGVVWHGFALNVSCDLAAFGRITPCRQPDAQMTSLVSEFGASMTIDAVQRELVQQFSASFLPAAAGLGSHSPTGPAAAVSPSALLGRDFARLCGARRGGPSAASPVGSSGDPIYFAHPASSAAVLAPTGPAAAHPLAPRPRKLEPCHFYKHY